MSKRAINQVDGSEQAELSRETKRQRRHLTTVIEDGAKDLFHALRFARGFERQKLGRRQKSAKKKEDRVDLERLTLEVSALKNLVLPEIAETYFCRQLLKIKYIAEHEALPKFVHHKAKVTQPKDVAFVNVTSRLYKSAPMTNCLDRVLKNVRGVLGLRESEIKTKKKRLRKADYEAEVGAKKLQPQTEEFESTHRQVNGSFEDRDRSTMKHPEGDQSNEDSFASFNESDDENDIALGSEDGEEDEEDDYSRYDARIASDSDEDGTEEDLGDEETLELTRNSSDTKNKSQNALRSESKSVSISPSPPPRRITTNQNIDVSRGAFLPSLNAGYISGSDSEMSEASVLAPPRKNRMGQRARQELWERKFGNQARHLQKDGASMKNRDKGWDLKRGAQDSDRGGRRGARGGIARKENGRPQPQSGRGRQKMTGANSEPIQARSGTNLAAPKPAQKAAQKIPTYGKEHPSLIAKQARDKASAAVKPAGKKITFD